ncbi:MAG: hypothetical protein U5P10_12285 [Spirochaetia bacterium]|nr:hypothetical protein [Spirochaetia bacterium]
MKLEDSSGTVTEARSPKDIESLIDKVGKGIDHCILSDGDAYIQTAASGSGLLVQYGDSSGNYEGIDPSLPPQTVKKMFTAFFQHDESWKTHTAFSQIGEAKPASAASSPAGASQAAESPGSREDLKNSVINSVKREAQTSFSYMIRRVLRRFIRRIF